MNNTKKSGKRKTNNNEAFPKKIKLIGIDNKKVNDQEKQQDKNRDLLS